MVYEMICRNNICLKFQDIFTYADFIARLEHINANVIVGLREVIVVVGCI